MQGVIEFVGLWCYVLSMESIYIIGPESGPYKVGKTSDVSKRLAALQTANPFRLKVHFSIQEGDASGAERDAHNALAKHRLSGEWFDAPLDEIISAIERRGATVTVAPTTMGPETFVQWLGDMKSAGLARSDAECARLLGISANSVVALKRKGADTRTALACRALLHRLAPYE